MQLLNEMQYFISEIYTLGCVKSVPPHWPIIIFRSILP